MSARINGQLGRFAAGAVLISALAGLEEAAGRAVSRPSGRIWSSRGERTSGNVRIRDEVGFRGSAVRARER